MQITNVPKPEVFGSQANTWHIDRSNFKTYSVDEVIEAYISGKAERLNSYKKAVYKQIQDNVEASSSHTTKLVDHLKEKGFSPTMAFLKLNSIDCLEVLIAVPEEDFLNPSFLSVYQFASVFEETISNDTCKTHFGFLGSTKNLNIETINSHGFFFSQSVA